MVEGKAVEDADYDTDEELTVQVAGVAPVLDEGAFGEFDCLGPDWDCEFVLGFGFLAGGDFATSGFQAVDLGKEVLILLRFAPLLVPIQSFAVFTSSAALCRGFENEFCDVFAWRASRASVRKVFDYCGSVLANRPKVEGVSTRVEG